MLGRPYSLDHIHIRSNLYSKHLILVILIVTMCSWFHYDSYGCTVQKNHIGVCSSAALFSDCPGPAPPSENWHLPYIRQIVGASRCSQLYTIPQDIFNYVWLWLQTIHFCWTKCCFKNIFITCFHTICTLINVFFISWTRIFKYSVVTEFSGELCNLVKLIATHSHSIIPCVYMFRYFFPQVNFIFIST